jgi:hypothetical protein
VRSNDLDINVRFDVVTILEKKTNCTIEIIVNAFFCF